MLTLLVVQRLRTRRLRRSERGPGRAAVLGVEFVGDCDKGERHKQRLLPPHPHLQFADGVWDVSEEGEHEEGEHEEEELFVFRTEQGDHQRLWYRRLGHHPQGGSEKEEGKKKPKNGRWMDIACIDWRIVSVGQAMGNHIGIMARENTPR